MLLLFFCLYTGIVKLEMIEKASDFLLENLAFFFLPAGVSLITCFSLLKGKLVEVLLISLLSTIVILVVTGLTIQFVQSLGPGKYENSTSNCRKKERAAPRRQLEEQLN